MVFRDEKQRKAMFANMTCKNKFSYGQPVAYCYASPARMLGDLGEHLAGSVVKTFPERRTGGVVGVYPDRGRHEPTLGEIIEGGVLGAYPDGLPVDSYGEAFAVGKAEEWARLNEATSRFSLDEYGHLSPKMHKIFTRDIEEARGMGVYSDEEAAAMQKRADELLKKRTE